MKVFSPPPTKKVLAGAWGKAEGHTLRILWLEAPEVGIGVGAWAMAGSGVEGGLGGLGGGWAESLTATVFRYFSTQAVLQVWGAEDSSPPLVWPGQASVNCLSWGLKDHK